MARFNSLFRKTIIMMKKTILLWIELFSTAVHHFIMIAPTVFHFILSHESLLESSFIWTSRTQGQTHHITLPSRDVSCCFSPSRSWGGHCLRMTHLIRGLPVWYPCFRTTQFPGVWKFFQALSAKLKSKNRCDQDRCLKYHLNAEICWVKSDFKIVLFASQL